MERMIKYQPLKIFLEKFPPAKIVMMDNELACFSRIFTAFVTRAETICAKQQYRGHVMLTTGLSTLLFLTNNNAILSHTFPIRKKASKWLIRLNTGHHGINSGYPQLF